MKTLLYFFLLKNIKKKRYDKNKIPTKNMRQFQVQ